MKLNEIKLTIAALAAAMAIGTAGCKHNAPETSGEQLVQRTKAKVRPEENTTTRTGPYDYNHDGVYDGNSRITHTEDGRLLKAEFDINMDGVYDEDGTIKGFDDQGNLILVYDIQFKNFDVYKYNTKNQRVNKISVDNNGKIGSKKTYKYDLERRCVEELNDSKLPGKVNQRVLHEYDVGCEGCIKTSFDRDGDGKYEDFIEQEWPEELNIQTDVCL